MQRRQFLSMLGGTAITAPCLANAQQPGRTYRLGAVIPSGQQTPPIAAFFDELRQSGFVEGRNLEIIPGGFGMRNEQAAELAALMVKAAPDVIICGGVFAVRAVQQATKTLPVVALSDDMVQDGFVASLARPGGNITGISIVAPELDGKRQEYLIEAVPNVRRIAILADASTTTPTHRQMLQDAARQRGIEAMMLAVAKAEEIAPAMSNAKAAGATAMNVTASPLFGRYPNRQIVIERATALQMAGIYEWPEMAEEGGFAAYGARFAGIFRQVARQVARVLRGGNPAEIPVQQPTNFELVLNLKTAKAIGHEIPAGLVLRADKLVE